MLKPHWKKHRKLVNFLAVLFGSMIIGGMVVFLVTMFTDDQLVNGYSFIVALVGFLCFMMLFVLNKKRWI